MTDTRTTKNFQYPALWKIPSASKMIEHETLSLNYFPFDGSWYTRDQFFSEVHWNLRFKYIRASVRTSSILCKPAPSLIRTSILVVVNGTVGKKISTTQRFRNAEAKLVLSILQDLWERAKLGKELWHTEIRHRFFVSGDYGAFNSTLTGVLELLAPTSRNCSGVKSNVRDK